MHTTITVDGRISGVASFSLDVLEPASPEWTCDQVAFGERSPTELAGATAATLRWHVGESPEQVDVDRRSRHLVVAHAYDEAGTIIGAGCSDRNGGPSDVDVALALVPAPRLVAASPLEVFFGDLHGYLPAQLTVTVHDIAGNALADTPVQWQLQGPYAFTRETDAVSDSNGVAAFVTDLPNVPGPYRVRAKARWTVGPQPELVGFETPAQRVTPLGGVPLALATIPPSRSPSGHAIVVAQLAGDTCSTRYFVTTSGKMQTIELGANACSGLGVVYDGAQDVPIVAVTGGPSADPSLYTLSFDNGTVTPKNCGSFTPPDGLRSCVPIAVHGADPCGRTARAIVTFSCGGVERNRYVAVDSCVVSNPPDAFYEIPTGFSLVDVGCIDIDNVATNTAVARHLNRDYLFTPARQSPRAIVGVQTLLQTPRKPHGATLGLTGTGDTFELIRFSLLSGDTNYTLASSTTFALPSRATAAVTADLDGDGVDDYIAVGGDPATPTRQLILCIGREGDSPICAGTKPFETDGHDFVAVDDFDGDGVVDFANVAIANDSGVLLLTSLVGGIVGGPQ